MKVLFCRTPSILGYLFGTIDDDVHPLHRERLLQSRQGGTPERNRYQCWGR